MDKAKKLQKEINKIFGDSPANLVGGSVRDIILKREPKDWDYCTPLDPDSIEEKIRAAGRKPYLIGKKFGTVGFKVSTGKEFIYVEVTTYRKEDYISGSRKPNVEFIDDLDLDLSRRDFTINAMVLKEDLTTYDPHGGRLDILARQIKTVGLPKDRIQEDPLRMLRAARFASQLQFGVDPNFIGKMRQLSRSIVTVSKERWVQELDKMLMGAEPMRGIKILIQSELMKYILPEVYLSLLDDEAYQAIAGSFEKYPEMELDSRWALLLYFIGYPYTSKEAKSGKVTFVNHEIIRKELVDGICSRLKFSNSRRDNLLKNKLIFKTIAF